MFDIDITKKVKVRKVSSNAGLPDKTLELNGGVVNQLIESGYISLQASKKNPNIPTLQNWVNLFKIKGKYPLADCRPMPMFIVSDLDMLEKHGKSPTGLQRFRVIDDSDIIVFDAKSIYRAINTAIFKDKDEEGIYAKAKRVKSNVTAKNGNTFIKELQAKTV